MQLEATLPPQAVQVSHVPSTEEWPSDDCPHPLTHPPIHNFSIHNFPILLAQSTLIEQLPHTNDGHPVGRETWWKQLEKGPALRRGWPIGDKYEICYVLSTRSYNMKKESHRVISLAAVMFISSPVINWWLLSEGCRRPPTHTESPMGEVSEDGYPGWGWTGNGSEWSRPGRPQAEA